MGEYAPNKPLLMGDTPASIRDAEIDLDLDDAVNEKYGSSNPSEYTTFRRRIHQRREGQRNGIGCILFTLSIAFNVFALFFVLGSRHGLSDIAWFRDGFYSATLGNTPTPLVPYSQQSSSASNPFKGNSSTVLNQDHNRCPSSDPLYAKAPAPINPWAPLSVAETYAVEGWLFHPDRNLNLTHLVPSSRDANSSTSKIASNVVYHIEAWYPPKKDVLAYLDAQAKARKSTNATVLLPRPPARYARVTIHHGGWEVPVIKDYLVGPLHSSWSRVTVKSDHSTGGKSRALKLGNNVRMTELKDIYHRDEIPFNAYGVTYMEELLDFVTGAIMPIAGIMEDLFNATIKGLPTDTLVAGMSGPFSFDGSFRRMWMTWRRNKAGSFLLPVGFYQYVDMSGTDTSLWKVLKVVYHDQAFDSLEEFVDAYKNGTLVIPPEERGKVIGKNDTGKTEEDSEEGWTERRRIGKERDLDSLPGPRSVSFAGLRYRVDKERGYVSWMGWGMYLGFDRDMGLSLWDVRFRGERILYQLAPQDALAQYGGNDPIQATTAWLDRYFGMGLFVKPMLPNYDCPPESVYLPATTYTASGMIHVENAICIFEQDTGKPLTRHFGWQKGEFGAVKSYVLTIRSTTTVGNYDYRTCRSPHLNHYILQITSYFSLFDYLFYLDGTIEVRLSASGYMQGGYWNPKQDGYGGRIRHTSMGNLHDHVVNYKVDFDIAGTANSLLKTTTAQETLQHPWLGDDWGQTVVQQKITKEYIENENDALLKYPVNYQGGYAIVNKEETNKWGYPRGYAIHPGQSSVHNTVVGSKRLLNNANWARYNLAVSRRKETEPASSSMWNLNLPGAPMVDFHNFFDGENITQQDLVAWINLGMHHLPQAEDSPNTKTNVATSSFILTPLNYFDYDVSMELKNAILLQWPERTGDPFAYDDYGVKQHTNCLPDAPPPFAYPGVQSLVGDLSENGKELEIGQGQSIDEIRRFSEMFMRVELGGGRRQGE
ncbi:hypothetical protein D9613_004722 [Agrocybe pediades]|uniref:Amine oxidase n=1 Tax=Agrocybe pediades TaxID=84607 RepID=A0A8H4QZU1_9AGAR|nr:hypothetical protein D9613_004722 [Agrocybe pediades]